MNKEFLFTPSEIEKCQDKLLNAFGLAKRAGKCVVGTEMCVENIRNKKAKLVIAASDLSANTVKRLVDSCSFHGVDLIFANVDKAELGRRLGKNNGTSSAAMLDEGFVNICRKIYNEVHTLISEVHQ